VTSLASSSRSWWATAWGNVAFELARRHPDLPAAVVALDSAIVRPDWLAPEARLHAAGLRGPDFQEVQRRYAEEFFLRTDDAHLRRGSSLDCRRSRSM
jgi:pimeloyl-ACP methyl ester carboxylesterase